MPIDPSIYGNIRQFDPGPGPIELAGGAMRLRALMGQNQLQDLQRGELERSIQSQGRLRDLFARGNVRPEEVMAIDPASGMTFQKNLQEGQKSSAELLTKDRENFIAFANEARQRLQTIRDQGAWSAYRDEQIQRAGMFSTPQMRQQALRGAMAMPQQFDPNYIRDTLVKAEQLFTPQIEVQTLPDGSQVRFDKNVFTNPQAAKQPFAAAAMTPAQSASLAQSGTKNTREDLDNLRKEFNALDEVKNFKAVVPIVKSAQQAPDTPAGDIALAYAVGKILDPGSVVREGELQLVLKAGSPLQQIFGKARVNFGEGRMPPQIRLQLRSMLDNSVKEREQSYLSAKQTYEGIAKQRGHDPAAVFTGVPELQKKETIVQPGTQMPAASDTRTIGGKSYVKINGQWFEQ